MLLKFTKMHGCGNDFMVIDTVSHYINLKPHQIRKWSDRHFGIGFDQFLVVEPPKDPEADFRYRIYNADGEEVEQCGNGARCFAKFVRDKKLSSKDHLVVETLGGKLELTFVGSNRVMVDMGVPELAPDRIPFLADAFSVGYELEVNGQLLDVSAVSMGNPHCITLVNNVKKAAVGTLGPLIEKHQRFPQRVNAGFMQVVDRNRIKLRVYERGSGETLACGTGACAAVVAGRLRGLLDEEVNVHLPGGTLTINWQGEGNSVKMTGPCKTVYEGRIYI